MHVWQLFCARVCVRTCVRACVCMAITTIVSIVLHCLTSYTILLPNIVPTPFARTHMYTLIATFSAQLTFISFLHVILTDFLFRLALTIPGGLEPFPCASMT